MSRLRCRPSQGREEMARGPRTVRCAGVGSPARCRRVRPGSDRFRSLQPRGHPFSSRSTDFAARRSRVSGFFASTM